MTAPRRLRAPRQHEAILAEPSLDQAEDLAQRNRQQLGSANLEILGRPLADLRRLARDEALAEARAYLIEAGEPVRATPSDLLLVAGHQPELFHPGVWIKNFALEGLARRLRAVPLNLIIDNDAARSAAAAVPQGERRPECGLPAPDRVRLAWVPFDRAAPEVAYEEREVLDEPLFEGWGDEVEDLLRSWGTPSLVAEFWAEVRRQAARTPLLGERFAAARRALERRWGCCNPELPLSRLCRTEAFAWFACHLLEHLPRFRTCYNACLRAFRKRHGIRSKNHPVPELMAEGDWLEVPLWAWKAGPAQRGRLMARRRDTAIDLRVGLEAWPSLPRGGRKMVEAWRSLERNRFKVRTRALTTTLFARWFLGDLFVHGIGGARYDELTDEIAAAFWGLEPPGYLTLSATLLLPLPTFPVTVLDRHRLERQLRDLYWNPQRHVTPSDPMASQVQEWLRQKQERIASQPGDAQGRRERFRVLQDLTGKLRACTANRARDVELDLAKVRVQLQANAILQRRDYAFCLYPESILRPFLSQFLGPSS